MSTQLVIGPTFGSKNLSWLLDITNDSYRSVNFIEEILVDRAKAVEINKNLKSAYLEFDASIEYQPETLDAIIQWTPQQGFDVHLDVQINSGGWSGYDSLPGEASLVVPLPDYGINHVEVKGKYIDAPSKESEIIQARLLKVQPLGALRGEALDESARVAWDALEDTTVIGYAYRVNEGNWQAVPAPDSGLPTTVRVKNLANGERETIAVRCVRDPTHGGTDATPPRAIVLIPQPPLNSLLKETEEDEQAPRAPKGSEKGQAPPAPKGQPSNLPPGVPANQQIFGTLKGSPGS